MKAIVLTISDKGAIGQRVDTAGPAVTKLLEAHGYEVIDNPILPDDFEQIVSSLNQAVNNEISLILTVGGTGFSKRDITPEATQAVITRQTPGLNELMRLESLKITNRAMLSRATSGLKDNSLIVNLPGSEKAATENLGFILPILEHGLKILLGEDANCGVPVTK
ncbi:MogA/MoaB family molybdenum cofactor biosynthesis protein [Mollicutes bacterium LVI A0039]|nr:MogA/MoaB family molybdenum cofactor biosynthesis protein [Mollicutes bacterium LVI A0039]